jgi:hypothetical protein
MSRKTFVSRDVSAGCFVCHGSEAHWKGAQAQGTAARHHDFTGHQTWCDIAMSVRYGLPPANDGQLDIEAVIAAVSA